MRYEIKDRYGMSRGYIDDNGSIRTAYDRYGRMLGTYEPRTNTTKSRYGEIMAYGDILSALIWTNS